MIRRAPIGFFKENLPVLVESLATGQRPIPHSKFTSEYSVAEALVLSKVDPRSLSKNA